MEHDRNPEEDEDEDEDQDPERGRPRHARDDATADRCARPAVTVVWCRHRGERDWSPVQRCPVGRALELKRRLAGPGFDDWHICPDDPNRFRRADRDELPAPAAPEG